MEMKDERICTERSSWNEFLHLKGWPNILCRLNTNNFKLLPGNTFELNMFIHCYMF